MPTYGWFANYMPTAWNRPWAGADPRAWTDGWFYLDMARALERAGVDFVMLEDSSVVPENHGGDSSTEFMATVKAPKHDPLPLAAAIALQTSTLGVVTTMSTSLYPPHRVAHLQQTLSELSGGRAGWNVVTSFEDLAARNVGLDRLAEHDDRYLRAEDYLRAVTASWSGAPDPGASRATVRGAGCELPAGRPVLCQAGGSPAGMDFAARWADLVVSVPVGVEAMRTYRDGIQQRIATEGGDPDRCRVLYMVTPILADTDGEARALRDRMYAPDSDHLLRRLVQLSNVSEIDFAQFDLDQPVPEDATTNGAQSILEAMKRATRGSSLRAVLGGTGESTSLPLVGTPATVADRMTEALEEVGGDGFLFFHGGGGLLTRRYLHAVLDGLVPELARRGMARGGPATVPFSALRAGAGAGARAGAGA